MTTLVSNYILYDVIANLPTFHSTYTAGRLFYATDEGKIYRDNGTSWDDLAVGSGIYQPLDADLTAIAALTIASGKFLVGRTDVWALDNILAADLPNMVGDSGAGGTKGAVPAPAAGDAAAGKFLKADGTWATPLGGTDAEAIHDNVSGEIAAITHKTVPTGSDLLLIEDAADTNAKKYSTITEVLDAAATQYTTINIVLDGGGSALTTGIKADIQIDFAATIISATLLADQSGSIVIDLWKDTYANFPPTDADSITASAPPTLSAVLKSTDATLTGWTTSISAGDILRINVDSVSTIERVTLALKVQV